MYQLADMYLWNNSDVFYCNFGINLRKGWKIRLGYCVNSLMWSFVRFRVGVGIMRLRATDVANILEVGCEVVASYEKDRVVESVP